MIIDDISKEELSAVALAKTGKELSDATDKILANRIWQDVYNRRTGNQDNGFQAERDFIESNGCQYISFF